MPTAILLALPSMPNDMIFYNASIIINNYNLIKLRLLILIMGGNLTLCGRHYWGPLSHDEFTAPVTCKGVLKKL